MPCVECFVIISLKINRAKWIFLLKTLEGSLHPNCFLMEFCNIRKESFLFGHGCWNTPVGGEISVTSFYYFVRDNDREKVFLFPGWL